MIGGRSFISRRWRGPLLFAAALLVLLPGIGGRDIVTSHEARVAQVARQMSAVGWPWSGSRVAVPKPVVEKKDGMTRLAMAPGGVTSDVNPWLIPVFNGQMRLQKPPLPYWCAAILFNIAGGFGEGLSRLTGAVMGAGCAWILFSLGRDLFGRRVGWFAGLLWISSYFTFDEFRKAMADPFLAFFCLLCVWAWIKAVRVEDRRRQVPLLLVFYASLALGSLAKFPVNLLHVPIPLLIYHLLARRRPPGVWWQHLVGIGLFLLIALPWPLYVLSHVERALELWRYESVGEFADNEEKARHWWFYLPGVLQIALPWTILWLIGLATAFIPRGPAVRRAGYAHLRRLMPVIWFIALLIVFSISNVKKNTYLLPVLPAMILSAAVAMRWLVALLRVPRLRGLLQPLLIAHVLIGVGFAAVLPWLAWKESGHSIHSTGTRLLLGLASVGAAAVAGALPWLTWRRFGPTRWAAVQALCFAVLISLFFNCVNAPADNRRSAKAASGVVLERLKDPETTLLVSTVPEEAFVYLPLGLKFDPSKLKVLVMMDDRKGDRGIDPEWLQDRIPSGRLVSVERIPVTGPQAGPRFKVYLATIKKEWLAAGRTED